MNNREKAKAVQKKFNQRLGIYYGVMAAGVIVAAIGLMTQINVLTLLGVVAFFCRISDPQLGRRVYRVCKTCYDSKSSDG